MNFEQFCSIFNCPFAFCLRIFTLQSYDPTVHPLIQRHNVRPLVPTFSVLFKTITCHSILPKYLFSTLSNQLFFFLFSNFPILSYKGFLSVSAQCCHPIHSDSKQMGWNVYAKLKETNEFNWKACKGRRSPTGNVFFLQGTLLFFLVSQCLWFNCFKFVSIFLYNWAQVYLSSPDSNRVGTVYLHLWPVLPEYYSVLLIQPGIGRLNVKTFLV